MVGVLVVVFLGFGVASYFLVIWCCGFGKDLVVAALWSLLWRWRLIF